MCVLTGGEIDNRAGEIFSNKSWCSASFQEASYDLRVDTGPFLRIGGKLYDEVSPYKESFVEIKPGELAMLPTVESFCMPNDLVGDIKIKFSHSRQGLTPLFGPKVDPKFGNGHDDERLYLWVSNLGLKPIVVERYEAVFTVQFHQLVGPPPDPEKKNPVGPTVAREIRKAGTGQYLGFTEAIKGEIKGEFETRLTRVEEGTRQVVIFGVFLVASALFASALGAILAMVSVSNTKSGIGTFNVLEGSNWGDLLFLLFVGLAILVVILIVAAVVKLAYPITNTFRSRDGASDPRNTGN